MLSAEEFDRQWQEKRAQIEKEDQERQSRIDANPFLANLDKLMQEYLSTLDDSEKLHRAGIIFQRVKWFYGMAR